MIMNYGNHQYLSSFPTRRSSDLTRISGVLASHRVPRRNQRASQQIKRLDRKSTRLNSSHRTTSYAVFCLKKKRNFDAARLGFQELAWECNYQGQKLLNPPSVESW